MLNKLLEKQQRERRWTMTPTGVDLLALLIKLLEEQEGVKIRYELEGAA